MIEAIERSVPTWDYPSYEANEPVALFIPCFVDQYSPEAGIAVTRVLDKLGVKYEYPEEQTCCGQAAFNSGYWDQARSVMKHFAEVFGKYRIIVTPSAACAAMCRVFYQEAAPDTLESSVGARVYEFSEFLVNILGKTDLGARFPQKVALHVGCHGRRELGMAKAAESLLKGVKDLEYIPIPNVEECCGFGGTFSVKMSGTSLAMGRKKVANITKAYEQGVRVLATTDMSCAMHFGGIIRRERKAPELQIRYIAELLTD
ncbi:MAG: (Fe-S)-binding protein [Planctomycetia bacterium]|nr:(Fe-S)-binding protein [Planctomycetia bacterium]